MLSNWIQDRRTRVMPSGQRWSVMRGPISGRQIWTERSTSGLSMRFSSGILLFNVFLSTALGFPYWLIAARMIDSHALGLGSGVLSAGLLGGNIALIGAGTVIITSYPSNRHNPIPLFRTAFTVVGILSVITGLGTLTILKMFFSQLGAVLWTPGHAAAFVFFIVAWSWLLLFDAVNLALRRADQLPARTLTVGVLRLAMLVTWVLVLGSDRLIVIVISWLVATIAGCALGQYQIRRILPLYTYRPRISWIILCQIIKRGLSNHTVTLALTGASLIVPLVVTEVVSPTANAHWYALWMIAALTLFVPDSIAQAFLAQASDTPQTLSAGIRQSLSLSLTLSIGLAISMAMLAEMLLGLLGPAYAAAGTTPLRILLLGVVARTCIETYVAVCRVTNQMREAIVSCTLLTGGTVIGVAIGGHEFGLIGIAVAWLAVQSLGGVWAAARLHPRMHDDLDDPTSPSLADT